MVIINGRKFNLRSLRGQGRLSGQSCFPNRKVAGDDLRSLAGQRRVSGARCDNIRPIPAKSKRKSKPKKPKPKSKRKPKRRLVDSDTSDSDDPDEDPNARPNPISSNIGRKSRQKPRPSLRPDNDIKEMKKLIKILVKKSIIVKEKQTLLRNQTRDRNRQRLPPLPHNNITRQNFMNALKDQQKEIKKARKLLIKIIKKLDNPLQILNKYRKLRKIKPLKILNYSMIGGIHGELKQSLRTGFRRDQMQQMLDIIEQSNKRKNKN